MATGQAPHLNSTPGYQIVKRSSSQKKERENVVIDSLFIQIIICLMRKSLWVSLSS
ncbi:hypothetical protein [Priestia filamentosa]|uniref:hypothetical protein n=1 Tax=Priestia filamentosa TaxID=1402861 RepID=UPI0016020BAA|nr:hypothetical protein [Priestia filamentosa]